MVALAAACGDAKSPEAQPRDGGDNVGPDAQLRDDAGKPQLRTDGGGAHHAAPLPGSDAAGEPPPSTEPGSVLGEPTDEASYVFDQTVVRTYNLVIAPADLAILDQNPAAEQYVPATLEFEGKSYGPLAVRYKGSIGSFLYPCTVAIAPGDQPGSKIGKCSIKIDFNRTDPALRFFGLKELNLHAMGADKSQMRERLGYALFREAGVAAPRAMHARVTLNGQLEGLFVAVESIDGRFTRARFSEGGKGNLYKEVWPTRDDAAYYAAGLETNETQADVTKMLAFRQSVAAGASWPYLDRAYTYRYLAVDRLIANDDGALHWYCQNRFGPQVPLWNHNFYWYEASYAQRLWIVPWDLDSAFRAQEFVRISPSWNASGACLCLGNPAQQPATCDPLIAQWAASQADYGAAVDAFVGGPYAKPAVDQKLDAWYAQIAPFVSEAGGLKGAPSVLEHELALVSLRTTIDQLRSSRGQ
jgi:CotH kinase protein